MNALLMFLVRTVVAVESAFRQWRKNELDFPSVVQAIESLAGGSFCIQADHPRACPELSFYDYAGDMVTVFLSPNDTISLVRGELWVGDFSPAQALQTIWSDLRGR